MSPGCNLCGELPLPICVREWAIREVPSRYAGAFGIRGSASGEAGGGLETEAT